MEEQDKIPGEELNEVEISDLSNKEIKVMTIEMTKELERRINEQTPLSWARASPILLRASSLG